MNLRTVRHLFVFTLILLPIQYALVGVVGHTYGAEPWPALVLPAFQSVWDREGPVSVDRVALEVTFSEGERTAVPIEAFLADLPRSQHLGFFRSQCAPASISGTTDTERCLHPAAVRWVAARLDTLFPDRSPRGLDVIWNRLTYLPSREAAATQSTPVDTLTLRW